MGVFIGGERLVEVYSSVWYNGCSIVEGNKCLGVIELKVKRGKDAMEFGWNK